MATTNGGPLRAPDTTVVFTPSTITIAVGETATINYVSGTAAPSASTLDTLFGGIATTEVDGGGVVGTVVISGVSAGTASIERSTPLGNGATMGSDGFSLTVTAPVDDDEFLNKRGLTHFWDNIDNLKQDKLTAGTNITISANNTISASQPTVGNATLTIQKNGTNVQTFTANATSNRTANITVPTTVAELSDSSNYATTTDLAAKQNLLSPGNHIDITSDVISATGYVHSENPQAAAAASSTITGSMIASGTITADKLASDATVKLTLSTSDIGEGAPLAANTLYGVYI